MKIKCYCGEVISTIADPNPHTSWLVTDDLLDRIADIDPQRFSVCTMIQIEARQVFTCPQCGDMYILTPSGNLAHFTESAPVSPV